MRIALGINGSAAVSAMALLGVGCAHSQPAFEDPPAHSKVQLVSETEGVAPDTITMLALVFEIDKGWHTYADSANDSGAPLKVDWSLPEGAKVGEPIWPASHRYIQAGGILDHVYENRAVVMFPLSISGDSEICSDAVVSASLEWLVCDDSACVPQFAEISITLPIKVNANRGEDAAIIDQARQDSGVLATGARSDLIMFDWIGDTLRVSNIGGYDMSFIPGPGCVRPIDLLDLGHSETGELKLTFDFDNEPRGVVEGWIWLQKKEGKSYLRIQSDLYLIRLGRGKKPTLILGER